MNNRTTPLYEVNEDDSKILLLAYPLVDSYPATSCAMAILQTYLTDSKWFYNSFIQLYEVQNKALDFFDFSMENNPFLVYSELDFAIINKISNLKDFIITSINEGYYVRLFINTKYISLYNCDVDFYHDIMVYGYDRTHFFVADHFSKGKFSFEKVEIDIILRAYDILKLTHEDIESNKHICLIQLLKPEISMYRLQMDFIKNSKNEKESLFSVDFLRIKKSIEDYIMCRPTYGWYSRIRGINNTIYHAHMWGINCYEVLKKHVYSLENDKFEYFATQSFYIECLHKKMMKKRIEMITAEGLLNNGYLHEKHIADLYNETRKLLNLYLKEKMTQKDKRQTNKLISLINTIVLKEQVVFENILDDFLI